MGSSVGCLLRHCLLFTLHTSHQTTNSLKTTKSVWTQTYVKQKKKNIKHNFFEELVPSVLPLLKRHIRLGHAGISDHSIDLSMTDFFKVQKKNGQTQDFFFNIT